jgi:small subunit ribosomal protein S8
MDTQNEKKIIRRKLVNKTTNDPVSDFLTRIRNSLLVNKEKVSIPYSKLKMNLAKLLKDEGFINDIKVVNENDPALKSIIIDLRYVNKVPAIKGLRKVSKPGLRKYSKSKYAPRVLSGLGISVLSTSKGLLTDRKARKENVGGEILCQVW